MRELCTTGITYVWFIPSMKTDMFLQTTTSWELCTTAVTFVWFIPSVDKDKSLQTTTVWELCTTCVTFVCFFPCGHGHGPSDYNYVRIVHHRYHARAHARTHARAHARTHARTHAHTHTHTHTHGHAALDDDCLKTFSTNVIFETFLSGVSIHIHSHIENTSAANLFTFTTLTGLCHNVMHSSLQKLKPPQHISREHWYVTL